MKIDHFLTMSPVIPEEQKQTYDAFVREYVVDYNGYLACIRIGHLAEEAAERSQFYLAETYVQCKIRDYKQKIYNEASTQELPEDPTSPAPLDKEALKQHVLAGLMKESMYHGPGSNQGARVSALNKLAAIAGLDAKEEEPETETQSVMVVPGASNLDAWEQEAMKTQERLKSEVVQ